VACRCRGDIFGALASQWLARVGGILRRYVADIIAWRHHCWPAISVAISSSAVTSSPAASCIIGGSTEKCCGNAYISVAKYRGRGGIPVFPVDSAHTAGVVISSSAMKRSVMHLFIPTAVEVLSRRDGTCLAGAKWRPLKRGKSSLYHDVAIDDRPRVAARRRLPPSRVFTLRRDENIVTAA